MEVVVKSADAFDVVLFDGVFVDTSVLEDFEFSDPGVYEIGVVGVVLEEIYLVCKSVVECLSCVYMRFVGVERTV